MAKTTFDKSTPVGGSYNHDHDEDPKNRLFNSISSAYRQLRQYRTSVRKLNQYYAGPSYGDQSTGIEDGHGLRPEKFLNLSKQALSAHLMLLASNNPQVLVTSHRLETRAFAAHYQIAINNLLEEIKFAKTLRRWVRDAYFWMGVIRVHMADTGRIVHEGDINMDPGMPFISNIALDDFFYDTNAHSWSECRFMGDIYRLAVEDIKNSGIYSGKEVDDIVPTGKFAGTEDRVENLSTGREIQDDELRPMADLTDVWLPRQGVVRTFVVKSRSTDTLMLSGEAIAEIKWVGNELGPYKSLHFDEVSGNVMPLSTAADLYPLDKLINNLYRKNAYKAKRRKEIHLFTPAAEDDANRAKRGSDGDFVNCNAPGETKTIATGGVDPGLHGFMLNGIDLFDRMAGNLPSILGLSASAPTATQEQILSQGANGRINQLQDMIREPITEAIQDLGLLLWNDEFTELPHRQEVEGLPGFSYDSTWRPGQREGSLRDFRIRVDVHSLRSQGPGERVAALNQLLATLYIPMQQMLAAQGGAIDFAKLVAIQSDLLNLPRLKEIITFANPPTSPSEQNSMSKPANTSREYVRRDAGGADQGATSDAEAWLSQVSESQA